MANRFWVGGTASWDGTAGTKWSTTSGGAGGSAIPTSSDDVFFDAASGASTVTIASGNTGAKSITCTGFTGTLTGSTAITVSGSILLVSGMTFSYTGTLTVAGTGTITSAGKTFSSTTVSGSGITVTLADAFTCSGTVTLTQGTLDAAANDVQITTGIFSSSNSNTRTLKLGATNSELFISATTNTSTAWTTATATNLTVTGLTAVTFTNNTTTSPQGVSTGSYSIPILKWQSGRYIQFNAASNITTLKFPTGGYVLLTNSAPTITNFDTSLLSSSNGAMITSNTNGTQRGINSSGSPTASYLAVNDLTISGATLSLTNGVIGNNCSNITNTSSGSNDQAFGAIIAG